MTNQRKRILLVDDEPTFLLALEQGLKDSGYEVRTAKNGKVAESLIGIEEFDAVISDIRMPEGNGIELLHYIKRTKPTLPVVLITGYAEVTQTKEAEELGAKGFLEKPFKIEDLREVLKLVILENGGTVEPDTDDKYCKLNLDDFVSGKENKFDLFIRLGKDKFVKIVHEGESLSADRISSYKSKNIRFLYMKREDFRKYVGFNLSLSKMVTASSAISKEKKLNFLKHTGEVILEHIYLDGVDKEGFESAKTMLETTVSVLSDQDDLFQLLSVLNSHGDFLYAHSLGVSLYSAMIAKQVKWNSPTSLFKISMGGLFHDIGLKEIDRSLLTKKRRDMTAAEIKIIETHAFRGMEILNEIRAIPTDVIQIAQQHHENCIGTGYPLSLKKSRIHPLARLVAIADDFCELALKGAEHAAMPPKDAIGRMLVVHPESYEPELFKGLMQIFSFDPPVDFGNSLKRRTH